jgi:hypothetical protein
MYTGIGIFLITYILSYDFNRSSVFIYIHTEENNDTIKEEIIVICLKKDNRSDERPGI